MNYAKELGELRQKVSDLRYDLSLSDNSTPRQRAMVIEIQNVVERFYDQEG